MKRLLKKMVFLPFLAVFLFGCGSAPLKKIPQTDTVQGKSLDTAIQEAARNIEQNIDAKLKVVVLNFSSTSTDFSEYVLGELSTELVNGKKLQVVDRKNLDAIRAEMDFQLSGEVSDESAQAIGRKLGAEYIVSGSLTNTGGIYRFRINTINVESAGIAASSAMDIANDNKVQALLASRGGAAVTQTAQRGNTGGNTTVPATPVQSAAPSVPTTPPAATTPAVAPTTPPVTTAPVVAPPAPPAVEYKVGDRGPSGGWIFYDKGRVLNGWRYLEAAPRDEPTAEWGANDKRVGGTNTGVGAGKRNTELILEYLNSTTRETGRAAQFCDEQFAGSFDDWFLPSKDELNLMYQNLKVKGLGGFGSGSYWSSSEVDSDWTWVQRFSDGEQNSRMDKNGTLSVRAIRQF
jgi:TolB-like protein